MGELDDLMLAITGDPHDGKCNRCNGNVDINMGTLEWECENCGVIKEDEFELEAGLQLIADRFLGVARK